MKILLINQTFWPDAAATAQHLTDLVVHLGKSGHKVTVMTAQRGYTAPHPLYPKEETFQGVRIVRVWPFHFGRKNKFLRTLDALFLNLLFAFQMLWLGRFDKVVSLTSPPLVAFVALIFAKLHHSRFLLWLMDLNPDEAIQAGWIKASSPPAKILEQALRFVLKYSDAIIVLDHYMKDRIFIKGAVSEKIHIVPPWNPEEIHPVAHKENPFRREHGLDEKFIVMYSGNHSLCHPLDTLLESAEILKDDPQIIFLFIGGGDRVKDVWDFKQAHGLSNIIHLPYQKREDLSFSLSAADLHSVVMGDGYSGIVHPSKIYGILKTGRPFVFIGPEQSPIAEIIHEYEIGAQVQHGQAQKLANIILEAKGFSDREKQMIQVNEHKMAENFSASKTCRRIEEIILQ